MNTFSNRQTSIVYKAIMTSPGMEKETRNNLKLYAKPTNSKLPKLQALVKIQGVSWIEIKKALNVKPNYDKKTKLENHDTYLAKRKSDLKNINSNRYF